MCTGVVLRFLRIEQSIKQLWHLAQCLLRCMYQAGRVPSVTASRLPWRTIIIDLEASANPTNATKHLGAQSSHQEREFQGVWSATRKVSRQYTCKLKHCGNCPREHSQKQILQCGKWKTAPSESCEANSTTKAPRCSCEAATRYGNAVTEASSVAANSSRRCRDGRWNRCPQACSCD